MSQVELIMPKMGESVAEATITKWLKKEGDKIAMDEAVLEIATDKVDSEIPSPHEGILTKILYQEGDVVQVGKAVALISSETAVATAPAVTPAITHSEAKIHLEAGKAESVLVKEVSRTSSSGKFYSPLVRNIAKTEGISLTELDNLKGTGHDGRVTKNDILAYLPVKGRKIESVPATVTEPARIQASTNGTSHSKPAVSIN
ncbi:MAG TPA: biotin/lipoyl-containing protein, partial [Bacteroidia bacterium]|nr:biotin/lipoyl-containing protein [Bacteroidia bacterium]